MWNADEGKRPIPRSWTATVVVVTNIARQNLANLLRDVRGLGSFSTRRTAPVGDLSVEVRGVGSLRLPVTAAQAKELRLIARPARYGKETETLLDRRVRDTWEVPRSRVSIDGRRWANTLRPMLELIRADLGLAATTSLDAELHSMLVYEPGQFFAAHQDSEKDDRMIGSLVVLLPSRSSGGDLVVSHRGQSMTYRGSATALTFIAFYADTRHEVLPVETGYRVALTYNLRLSGDANAAGLVPGDSTAAVDLLRQHFATPVPPRWRHDEAGEPPDRLVFLLDHQYSEHSLRWTQLKGEDASRSAVLRETANGADCDVALALTEIRETWDVEYVEYRRGRRGRSSWDDDGPDPDDVDALGSLIDSDIEIRPVEGRSVGARRVADAELASVTPTVEVEPYDTEYTGNMGNYGNTMDRWYRRAAVVIWPRSRTFALKAKGDPAGALDELLALSSTNPSEPERRVDMVRVLLRFWADGVRGTDQRTLLQRTLLLAADLRDADLAASLLAPFALEAFTPDDAPSLMSAVEQYGQLWFDERVVAWMREFGYGHRQELPTRIAWATDLDAFCARLLEGDTLTDAPNAAARALTMAVWAWLRRTIQASNDITQPSVRRAALASLGPPLLAVLNATSMIFSNDIRREILSAVCPPNADLTPLLLDTISTATRLTPTELTRVDLDPIARHAAATVRSELARPERQQGDWAINDFQQSECCQDCGELAVFLTDSSRKQHVWPMAKPRREHIHRRLDEAELPVTHQTRREGSPHKLVLTKTADVFCRDTDRHAAARTELATVERFLQQIGTPSGK